MGWKRKRDPFSDYVLCKNPRGGYWLWMPSDNRPIPDQVLHVLCLLERNGILQETEVMFWHRVS